MFILILKKVDVKKANRVPTSFLQEKEVMQSDAAMTEEISAYNIVPLDAPSITNAIGDFPEVPILLIK